jgi:chromosome segregation ATPase
MEDDEDEDVNEDASSSTSSDTSQRGLSNRDDTPSDSLSDSPEPKPLDNNILNGLGQDVFQTGSIVRVKLKDFVTYSSAEFFPGPNLNMIIGPNGTGKSSLVCAICLGLGWEPSVLGRAGKIGEFVKHDCDYAEVEIELQGENGRSNHVVRVRITKDGNGREWFMGGKKTSHKAVQTLMKQLSIQIDNLCQFLPQDKVADFAKMSPVKLLEATQRAAAPEEMLEWHDQLKTYRKEQKALEGHLEEDNQTLQTLEARQASLRAEVDKLEEINRVKDKVKMLKKTIPFIEYKTQRLVYRELDSRREIATRNLAALTARVQPTLEATTLKEQYGEKIALVVRQRERILHAAEKEADATLKEITNLDEQIAEEILNIDAEKKASGPRRQAIVTLKKAIERDEDTYKNNAPREFIPSEWNPEIVSKYILYWATWLTFT